MDREGRQRVAHEVLHELRDGDHAEPAISFVGVSPYQPSALETVDDAGYGAMGEANLAAQVFEAHALRVHQGLHHAALRAGKLAPCELGLERLADQAPNSAQVLIDLLRHYNQLFPLAHSQVLSPPFQCSVFAVIQEYYNTKGIRAFTSFLY